MKKKDFDTIGQWFFWCYSNMAMCHVALKNNHLKFEKLDYMVRAKLYKGLCSNSMHISTLFDDEKYKMENPRCAYCDSSSELSVDHLISKASGGLDSGDNLIIACKSCNSSKNKKDLLEWCFQRQVFPPILVLRRYLKLAYKYFNERQLLEKPYRVLFDTKFDYRIDLLPYEFPQPINLKM